MILKDKKILVTGASSGIGKAIATQCAKEGAGVVVHYHSNKKGSEETLKEIEKHSKGITVSADLTEEVEAEKMFAQIKEKGWEDLDCLVNNAGEANSGELDNWDIWEMQWKNIFMSQVYCSNRFLARESKDKRKILNISSIYGIAEMGNPDFLAYSAAKAAVISLTSNLAKIYAPNVLVNAISPGFVWTPSWEGTDEEELEKCKAVTRIKRFIEPEEIATMAVELLRNDAITGETIKIDGGLHLIKLR